MKHFTYNLLALVAVLFGFSLSSQAAVTGGDAGVKSPPASTQFRSANLPQTRPAGYSFAKPPKDFSQMSGLRAAGSDMPEIYGSLIYTAESAAVAKDMGIYTLPEMKPVRVDPVLTANGGGVLANGKYHFIYYYEMSGAVFAYYRIVDVDTWETLYSARTDQTSIATDMAYDPITDKIYGCFVGESSYVFGTLSKDYGEVTVISYLSEPFFTLACNAKGEMYAITANGKLNRIDKTNGKLTPIGATGLTPAYQQSMTFDMATGRLFWAACTAASAGLYEVDTTSGKASLVSEFAGNEEFGGLYTLSQGAVESAPAELGNFSAEYVTTTQSDIAVSFTLPTTTYDGQPLSGNVQWIVSLNDVDVELGEGQPGSQVSVTLANASVGMNTITAYASNDAGKGPQSRLRKWIGVDTPLPLENVTATLDGNTATISWQPPTGALHGGYFDPAQLNYRVVRQPGNVTVCQKTTETSVTDELDASRLMNYYYDVITYVGTTRGETVSSNKVTVGDALSIPYTENFSNADDFNLFNIIDANNDGRTWAYNYGEAKSTYSMTQAMNDWLVTPPLKFEDGYLYTLRFKLHTAGFTEKMRVAIGNDATVEAMSTEIMAPFQITDRNYTEFKCTFNPGAGDKRIGFHHISDAESGNLFLDDIEVIRGASVKSPAVVEDLTVTPADKGALSCTVSFRAPSKCVDGSDLSSISRIVLYKGNKIIKSFSAPAPGATLSEAGIACDAGVNEFRVIASNDMGNGLEATASAYIGLDKPGIPNNVRVVEGDEEGSVVLTWEPPTTGENGGYIDVDNLKYHVCTQNFETGGVDVVAMDVEGCEFVDYPAIEGQQGMVAYYVYGVNEMGVGYGWISNTLVIGTPYALPFEESFAGEGARYSTWRSQSQDPDSQWGIAASGTYPAAAPYDNDGGLLTFQPGIEGAKSVITSGKIAMDKASNPVLEFYYYYNSLGSDKIFVQVSTDGIDYETVKSVDMATESGVSGWRKVSVPLTKWAKRSHIQLGFAVECGNDLSNIHFDDIVVRNVLDKDLAVVSIAQSAPFEAGKESSIKVNVANLGSTDASAFTVSLYRDGKEENTLNGRNLNAGEQREYEFPQTPDRTFGTKAVYSARVTMEGDANTANDVSADLTVSIKLPALPVVDNLTGSFDASTGTASLSWSAPDFSAAPRVYDGFEDYQSFLIRDFGDWMTLDRDKGSTVYFSNVPMWTNCSAPQAYIVFNPKAAQVDEPNPDGTPSMFTNHGGEQMLISFASETGTNDDWLVSPRLSGNAQEVSFWVKGLTMYYGAETWEFLVSTGDYRENISDFVVMEGVGGDASEDWTEIKVNIPAGVNYFAIHCTSADKLGFCVDDITFIPHATEGIELLGYDVYCNDAKVNETPVSATSFSQAGLDPMKDYKYNVVCVFNMGDSAFSNDCILNGAGVDGIGADAVSVVARNSQIVISGALGKRFAVYTPAGVALAPGIAAGVQTVPAMPGIYLVTVGSAAYKVYVK